MFSEDSSQFLQVFDGGFSDRRYGVYQPTEAQVTQLVSKKIDILDQN